MSRSNENPRLLLSRLEALYERFNRPEWIDPDPLAVARGYRTRADREVAALVAACEFLGIDPVVLS